MNRQNEDQRAVTIAARPDMWAGLIQRIPRGRPDGEGWRTIIEIAKDIGVSRQSAAVQVQRLRDAGMVDVVMGRSEDNHPTLYVRPKVPR